MYKYTKKQHTYKHNIQIYKLRVTKWAIFSKLIFSAEMPMRLILASLSTTNLTRKMEMSPSNNWQCR